MLYMPQLAPTRTESLLTAMRYVQNPRKACEHLYQQLRVLTDEIRERVSADPHSEFSVDGHLYICTCEIIASLFQRFKHCVHTVDVYFDETPDMMERRWAKLEKVEYW